MIERVVNEYMKKLTQNDSFRKRSPGTSLPTSLRTHMNSRSTCASSNHVRNNEWGGGGRARWEVTS